MLLLASALASAAPVNDQYRHKILTGLWCCYGSVELDKSASDTLFKWFNLALFGRHALKHEVTAWRDGCKLWLQGELVDTAQTAQLLSQTAQLLSETDQLRTESPRPLTPESPRSLTPQPTDTEA
jgi:hypothetical protein